VICLSAVVAAKILRPRPASAPVTEEIARADIRQLVRASGTVHPLRKVDVGAQVSGQVRTLFVSLGSEVKAGDRLVSLDADLASSDVVQGEAALAQQEAALKVRQLDSDRALLSDMTVAVQIETGAAKNAAAVPMRALGMRSTYGTYGVEVLLADGSVETRQVRVGLNDGSKAQIVEGVTVGERVVVGVGAATAEKPDLARPRKI